MTYTKDLQEWLQKTVRVSPETINKDRKWYIVDAAGKTLWRVAAEIAKKLLWKHKPYYCDMWDCWDYVIVTNAKKVKVTGRKMFDKVYRKHTWWKGHLRETNFATMIERHPDRVFKLAVKGMLPKTTMRDDKLSRMKIFEGTDHPYTQFTPEELIK